MSISSETLGAAKRYVRESLLGGGAVIGKNCTISSITPIDGGNRVEFSWTLDDGTIKTQSMDVMNGNEVIVDTVVSANSENAISSKAVKDYVDSSVKTEVTTQIESTVGDVVEQSVEEKVKENMETATNEEIDSLFA